MELCARIYQRKHSLVAVGMGQAAYSVWKMWLIVNGNIKYRGTFVEIGALDKFLLAF